MTLWEVLTKHRTIPSSPAWMCVVFFLGTGLYAGWLAVRPEPPVWNDAVNVDQIVQEQREMSADLDALGRALKNDDQDVRQAAIRQFESQQKTRAEQVAKRKADLAARGRANRVSWGACAAASIAVGILLWLHVGEGRIGGRELVPPKPSRHR